MNNEKRVYTDKWGDEIDLSVIYGVYKTQQGLTGFFQRCTNYSQTEIEHAVKDIMSNVEPKIYSRSERIKMMKQIEGTVFDIQEDGKNHRNVKTPAYLMGWEPQERKFTIDKRTYPTPIEMQEFPKNLQKRRNELKISFQKLSNLTGLNESVLQEYESGTRQHISFADLKVLAKALETSPEELLGWADISDWDNSMELMIDLQCCKKQNTCNLCIHSVHPLPGWNGRTHLLSLEEWRANNRLPLVSAAR